MRIMARQQPGSATEDEIKRARRHASRLHAWYQAHGRWFPWRDWRDLYRVAVVEILLQRTRAEVVAEFVHGFIAQFPSWEAIAVASAGDVEAALRPIGLQRRRSAVLQALARLVVDDRDRDWSRLPGIGQYVHRALLVATRGERAAMVDTNFVRVIRRAYGGRWRSDYRFDPRLQAIAAALVQSTAGPAEANWAVLDLGAEVCKPRRPLCNVCPIAEDCEFALSAALEIRSTRGTAPDAR